MVKKKYRKSTSAFKTRIGRFSLSVTDLPVTNRNHAFYDYRATITDMVTWRRKVDFFETESGACRWFLLLTASKTNKTGKQNAL